ncbi:MAG: lysine-sensitive aspartokinase 3 [Prolixibacteraceae bacterium]|nr:lysine-sensitive aspartokinase 3 [Prolixibacteraceae bacterium]
MIVMKFGGTSVRDMEWINKALDIAADKLNSAPLLIASAMGKTTDKLQNIAFCAEKGEKESIEKALDELNDFHINEAKKGMSGKNLDECIEKINKYLFELKSIVKGLTVLRECTGRSNDAILSFGELLSTTLIAHRAIERGINTQWIDSRNIIKTNDHFTEAELLEEMSNQLITKAIQPQANKLFVAQGFIGSNINQITTTLGRGGSDYSAAIMGAALSAREIQIWTDVDGILTTDPRVVSKAQVLDSISYKEAAELAYFGAKVIHPSTIQPAITKEIPVVVKNTGNPEFPGTHIITKTERQGLKAIAFKNNITVINISSYRMLLAYGFLRRIFEIFEKYKTPVDLISTSEVSVSVTIDKTSELGKISDELKKIGNVQWENKKAIICLVGQELWKDSLFISKAFSQLGSIPVRMVTLGSSDTNLSFVVPEENTNEAVQKLHKCFFEDNE